MKRIGLAVIAIAILVGIFLAGFYNSLINANETVVSQWAQVESQYQRRYDLIPNLVETVKGITNQEQEVFTAIAEARTRYSGAQSTDEKVEAANQLETAVGRLLVITENYPQLRSSESFQTLMAQLEGTENRISVERGRYNETVQAYNVKVKRFPGSMAAAVLGFNEKPYFEAASGAETAPRVQF